MVDKINIEEFLENSGIVESRTEQILKIKEKQEGLLGNYKANSFDISLFATELDEKLALQNKERYNYSSNITAYSIAHDCIMYTVKKILNYPVPSFGSNWLPIVFRTELGNSLHSAIQKNTMQFDEVELQLKVPSIRFYGKCDGNSGNNVIADIKGLPFKEYMDILKNNKPRQSDFLQVMCYKYIIENYLDEIKQTLLDEQSKKPDKKFSIPKLNKYEIDTLDLIYVAHDVLSSDYETISECLQFQEEIKKRLNKGNSNPFYFMSVLSIKVDSFDCQTWINFIKDKISAINYYVDSNKLPPMNHPYIKKDKCFFCMFKCDK